MAKQNFSLARQYLTLFSTWCFSDVPLHFHSPSPELLAGPCEIWPSADHYMGCSWPAAACAGCSQKHNEGFFEGQHKQRCTGKEGAGCSPTTQPRSSQCAGRESGRRQAYCWGTLYKCSKSGLLFPLPSLFNSRERYKHLWCLTATVLLLLVL